MEDPTVVLIVDNDPDYIQAVEKVFEDAGMIVSGTNNVDDALAVLNKVHIDVVITGLRIPGNGMELMQEIKRREELNPIVIFTTMFGEIDSYMDVMNDGAYDYLNREDTTIEDLLAKAKKALQLDPV